MIGKDLCLDLLLTSISKRKRKTMTTTGVKDLSICMKPTSNNRYTQFPVANVPGSGSDRGSGIGVWL